MCSSCSPQLWAQVDVVISAVRMFVGIVGSMKAVLNIQTYLKDP